jgi:hypothetical protein
LILVVAVGVLGFYLDWWKLNKTTQGDEIDITLSVDKNKIKKDTGAAVERVQQAGKDVSDQVRKAIRGTASGRVTRVTPNENALVVTRENDEPLTVRIDNDTVIKRGNDTVRLADIQVDQPVTVIYDSEDGKNTAQSITVETK